VDDTFWEELRQHMRNKNLNTLAPDSHSSEHEHHIARMLDSATNALINSLTTLQLMLDESEHELELFTKKMHRDHVRNMWRELKSEQKVLSLSVGTLLNLTKTLEVVRPTTCVAAQRDKLRTRETSKM
jgi:hypothetical protein